MIMNNRLIVQEALINCFICLDHTNKGFLEYDDFLRFFSAVYDGHYIEKNILQLWEGMDVDGNGQMQVDEFADIL